MPKLLILIILFSLTTFAQVEMTPNEKVAKARQSIQHARKKLKMSDSFFSKLETDSDLTTGELTQAAKAEHDLIISCLEKDELKLRNRRWLKQYLKIIDHLWDQEMYIGEKKTRYTVSETSSQIGQTAYGVDVVRDPNNPNQFLINNFYNIGFNYQIPVVQVGDKLIIKKQIFNKGSELSGSGYVGKNGSFVLDIEMNDGSTIDKCQMAFAPNNSGK